MGIRTVLLPLDGSEFSRQIVRVVRTFISPDGVELVLFRAAQPPSGGPHAIPTEKIPGASAVDDSYEAYSRAVDVEFDAATRERKDHLHQLEAELAADEEMLRSAGYSVRAEVQYGEPAQRIIEFVNTHNVDLVAMTTHGRSGLGRLVLGSVAERVVRGVSVPVLLMRSVPDGREKLGRDKMLTKAHAGAGIRLRIAAATDCSTLSQRAVALARGLVEALDADFDLLVVAGEKESVDHGQRLIEEATQQVVGLMPRPRVIPLVGYADEVLLEHLTAERVDLLCIGAFHDRGAGSNTAIGPTAQRLVQYAPTSVLMYKGHRSCFDRILACLAVDDVEIVDVAAQLAQATGAELSLLHVIPHSAASYLSATNGDDAGATIALSDVLSQGTRLSTMLKAWIGQLAEHGIGQDAMMLEQGSVPEAILKTAQEGRYDLVIVGTSSTPGHFPRSVANGVVRYAEQSVLLLRTGGPMYSFGNV